ncbi:MAG: glycine cleavage system aminomethyltransferase GcvT [Paracoccus sp. (in: a-proteobacteria)]|uniref:glycine cleavage system aminomethyltransferase GcvT n=1 Tax=Paracoccus sp. TaxID=267 RepID=UPI0026DF82DA|nr:glycine cleavage system aminomethyltransferase GcvT [Paracoccus sp. (in: a-proteobacteria)]MDO5621020.1 glycine cleavage system aminomethyltransferase GcvT [Paracoccus sp. (in: a-proteobacteria)]
MDTLKRTPLYDLHVELGGKMVPFAGWDMPVQYPMGVLGEHLHTRAHAGLFDVSHMGQVILRAPSGRAADAALVLESLIPADLAGLAEGRQRYGVFTDDEGGVLDDLMVANKGDHLFLVVNAACADQDIAHLQGLAGVSVQPVTDRALLALQGPDAESVLAALLPDVAAMRFMDVRNAVWNGAELWISRSGYTGEDGFEISVPAAQAVDFARALLADQRVAPIGLGARDSLRLEAGMPLYGHDMSIDTSPAEAGVGWSIQKIRRQGGARAGGFPGAAAILAELAEGPARIRMGLRPEGRAPIREGVMLFDTETGGRQVGAVCSGGFGPTVGGPVAMALLPSDLAAGTTVWAELRGKRVPVVVSDLPFITPSYKR